MPPDLWRFAQILYARPGVEHACLQLQASGSDVCLLLAGVWLERRRVTCTAARCATLQELARPWQRAVIAPLRQLRQDWRTAATQDPALAQVREQLKALELQAERALLEKLEQASLEWSEGEQASDWLNSLLGITAQSHRDALMTLRIAMLAD